MAENSRIVPLGSSYPWRSAAEPTTLEGTSKANEGDGMVTKKTTVTLPEEQVDVIWGMVADGTSPSISGFVQHAVGVALDDVAGWGSEMARLLDESGGPLADDERAWADGVLGIAGRDSGQIDRRLVSRRGPVQTLRHHRLPESSATMSRAPSVSRMRANRTYRLKGGWGTRSALRILRPDTQ